MPVPIASKRVFNSFSTYSYFVGVIIITVQWKLYWEEGGGLLIGRVLMYNVLSTYMLVIPINIF